MADDVKRPGWGDSSSWVLGMIVGLAIGASLGIAMDNVAVGIGFGIAIGVAFAIAFSQSKKSQAGQKRPDSDRDR